MMQVSASTIAERQQVVREALPNEWDPIGVGHLPEAHDEYDGCVPAIYALLVAARPRAEIINYLWWLETEQMGMPGNREAVERFADRLLAIRVEFSEAT